MKLDKRIIEGKKPLDCFDVDKAEQFIGKKGYFCDHISGFTDISNLSEDVLRDITPDENDCEVYKINCTSWEYFLPCEWVKEPEKKYRAFTLAEWIDRHEIGEVIHYRSKSGEIELRHMYVGTRHSQGIKKIIVKITLGDVSHTLDYLFEDYEIEVDGEWQPFGVIDEDKE